MERRLAAVLSAHMVGYSRLMEQDEEGMLLGQKAHLRDAIDPEIASRGGRMVKTTGDGLLVEFVSVQEAARCAIEIQSSIAKRQRDQPADAQISYRIGINLGDSVLADGDICSDGVNVAARLQGLCVPGGVCVSDIIHQALTDRAGKSFRDMGSQRAKNISRPIRVWQWTPESPPDEEPVTQNLPQQHIRYAKSYDNVQIAWASVGNGAPIFKARHWLNHREYEWRSPVWGPFLTKVPAITDLWASTKAARACLIGMQARSLLEQW
jgi:class 3 adenylate cyclase